MELPKPLLLVLFFSAVRGDLLFLDTLDLRPRAKTNLLFFCVDYLK